MKTGTVVQLNENITATTVDKFGRRTRVPLGGLLGSIEQRLHGVANDGDGWDKPVRYRTSNADALGRYMVRLPMGNIVLADATEFTVAA